MRRVLGLSVLVLIVALASCSSASAADEGTEVVDQILTDWAAKDAEAVASAFGTEGTFTAISTKVYVGEEAGAYLSQFVPFWETTRSGDAVDNGDGTFSFPILFEGDGGTVNEFVWTVEVADGVLIDLTETFS